MSNDPNQPLPCETMDDEAFMEERAQRAATVSSLKESNNPRDKAINRQIRNISDMMERVEKFTRILSRYEVDTNQTDCAKRFSEDNKKARLKDMRTMWLQLKRQDDFIKVSSSIFLLILLLINLSIGGTRVWV